MPRWRGCVQRWVTSSRQRAQSDQQHLPVSQIRSEGELVHFISPYDHIDVLQGQGTTIVECARQIGAIWGDSVEPDFVVAPAGGGGLMSGVSVASKGYWKNCKVVAAEPTGAYLVTTFSSPPVVSVDLSCCSLSPQPAGANDLHQTFYSAVDKSQAVWHGAVNPTTSICDGLLTATGRMTMPTLLRK